MWGEGKDNFLISLLFIAAWEFRRSHRLWKPGLFNTTPFQEGLSHSVYRTRLFMQWGGHSKNLSHLKRSSCLSVSWNSFVKWKIKSLVAVRIIISSLLYDSSLFINDTKHHSSCKFKRGLPGIGHSAVFFNLIRRCFVSPAHRAF